MLSRPASPLLTAAAAPAKAAAGPIAIVAAENFYGDVAEQIGGPEVHVTSILSNPDQDPHLFEVSPSVGRAVSGARIVIHSGIDYDPWMEKLLGAAKSADRKVIVVADLVGRKTGDNPHIWYDPRTMPALAKALTETLVAEDPAHAQDYRQREAAFLASLEPIEKKIGALRERLAGTPVTATEPVFGYMFEALGMKVMNESFQLSVMNDTEPSASDVAAFEKSLRTGQVKLLVYNSQATDPMARADGEDRRGIACARDRRHRDGAARQDLPGLDAERARGGRQGAAREGPMNAIELRDVTLRLGGRAVLEDVSLAIGGRELVGVLGPNGAGKTTLMRAVLGLVRPAGGSIAVLGRPAARGNPAIGYMPQVRAGLGTIRLSGWDVVASVVDGHRPGLPLLGKAGRLEVERVLDLVGARELAARPADRDVGWRAAAPAAGPGAGRQAAASPPRRAADQPRSASPAAPWSS